MPKFLHVGCGRLSKAQTTQAFAGPDWTEVRLDIDPTVKPDIVASMTDMSPVASGSMDALYSSHNIEHLYAPEVPTALGEFRRILAPDGFVVITCPDLQAVAAAVVQGNLTKPLYKSPAGPISAIDILYGFRPALAQGNLYMAHRTGFTDESLADALRDAGFAKAITRRRPKSYELWTVALRSPGSAEHLRALAAAHFPPG
jgi:ubiquinone/menaquinone biosynthesis C-methylase UbiE